jgi:AraC-like DNA-binding protein
VRKLREEYRHSGDEFSQELIVSNLELLLNYCKRFYARQFATRATSHQPLLARFERFLSEYFESDRASREGVPSVQSCAKQMGYSANYLSDLLRKETGKTTREHIQLVVIEKAKDLLLGSDKTVSQIAFDLGFEYPQHFSKLFRSKTGQSPAQFRS